MKSAAALAGALVLAAASCAHDERRLPASPVATGEAAPVAPPAPPQYLVADPSKSRRSVVSIPLGARGAQGVVVDRRRVIVGQGDPRLAPDVTPEPMIGASRVPGRFGGGFLFWTARSIYRADTFDGALVPVTRVPEPIERVSFGPKSALVRTHNGERWSIALPSGARAPVAIAGIADVGTLEDGRTIAVTDHGIVLTSIDLGGRFTDVTSELKGTAERVTTIGDDLWLFTTNDSAARLEADGRLSWFDKQPSEHDARRVGDPRWHGAESPLHAVFHTGASIDETSAVVVDSGDVYRVDVRTGELLSVIAGHLPPDAKCEGVPVPGDVVFACTGASNAANAFVVAHTLAPPVTVEQSFSGGGQFYASDDGGLAYTGSCQGGSSTGTVVCVRMPDGRWEERDVSGLATDGGAGDVTVARWVPRSDGRVVAIVVDPTPGIYDPQTASFQALPDEANEVLGYDTKAPPAKPGKSARPPGARLKRPLRSNGIVDSSWTFNGAALRGWLQKGESVELAEDGKVTRSPWTFDATFSGALALGKSKDGRLYQSTDHGMSWNEVTPPPTGTTIDLGRCTSAGCDLGAFYRVGWAFRPPQADAPKDPVALPPEVRRTRAFELACRVRGGVATKLLSRTSDSPEDLGLGASRLPVANDRNDWTYVRNAVPRAIVSAVHDPPNGDGDAFALRGMFSGFGTTKDGDVIRVAGPDKNALSLRRALSFVAPFDPAARVVRSTIAMSDVVAAARRAGVATEEILGEDPTELGTLVPITPADPTLPADIAVDNGAHGLFAIVRGDRVRVVVRAPPTNTTVVSGVALGGAADEVAFLEIDANGSTHVAKVGANGLSDLFDLAPMNGEAFYPANPDALAVGPKGDLAVVRTPSGSDPPSSLDPALLLVQGGPPVTLAPWSELRLAEDPACKAEPGGWRTTLQIIAPWIRVSTPELRVDDGPMLARVRWTTKRVCLEAVELKLPMLGLRAPQAGGSADTNVGTWIVGKGSTFARVGISEGIEWRQALDCAPATP